MCQVGRLTLGLLTHSLRDTRQLLVLGTSVPSFTTSEIQMTLRYVQQAGQLRALVGKVPQFRPL